jgi:hypothetical protein
VSKRMIGCIAILLGCGLAAGLLMAGCSTYGKKNRPPVTVSQILEMSKAGTPPANIIARIRESGTVYRMKASDLAELKAQGVADEVIDYMQQTYLHAIEQDRQLEDVSRWTLWHDGYWYGGLPCGWTYDPFWCGPEVIVVPRRDGRSAERVPSGGHHHDRR